MAKTEKTIKLESDIKNATLKTGVFGCLEVTIGFGGKERVDYMTYDTTGIFRCYEIKVTKSDFHSKSKNSFAGHYNYFVLTQDLYDQVKDEIPDWIGCYVGQSCVKRPKKQDIDNKVFSMRRSVNGKSTEITMPWTEMLKDSMMRSLYRDSQKLHKSQDKDYVDRTKAIINQLGRESLYYSKKFNMLYHNVRLMLGRDALVLLNDGKFLNEDEIKNEFTVHQQILTMNRKKLATYLHSFQGKEYTVAEIECLLRKTQKELDEGHEES